MKKQTMMKQAVEDAQLYAVSMALRECGFNKTKTAKMLGISRKGLFNLLRTWKRRKIFKESEIHGD